MSYLVAASPSCLHSPGDTASLQWTCGPLIARSLLIHALIIVAIVLSAHVKLSLSKNTNRTHLLNNFYRRLLFMGIGGTL